MYEPFVLQKQDVRRAVFYHLTMFKTGANETIADYILTQKLNM